MRDDENHVNSGMYVDWNWSKALFATVHFGSKAASHQFSSPVAAFGQNQSLRIAFRLPQYPTALTVQDEAPEKLAETQ